MSDTERSRPIPVAPGGFSSNEDEARWLADTIALRTREALGAIGINIAVPAEGLRELLLVSLNATSKRANTREVERRREAEAEVARVLKIAGQQGSRIFRLVTALKLAAQFLGPAANIKRSFSTALLAWIDKADFDIALAWPDEPFVEEWLRAHGYQPVHGKIGMVATAQLCSIDRQGGSPDA